MLCSDRDHRIPINIYPGRFDMNANRQPSQPSNYKFDTTAYEHRTRPELLYSARRNLAELTKLINRLFALHSRMLVIRIDFRYKKEMAEVIPIEIAQLHRDQLIADRRSHPDVFDDLLGYAWGLEYGEQEGGYHYHFLLFYHGARRQEDIGIGLALRDLWSTITNGYGQCYRSNFDKEKFESEGCLGIGMIRRNDIQLRINLIEKVAPYITKNVRSLIFPLA